MNRTYVTEIAVSGPPAAELQVLHAPMREPEPVMGPETARDYVEGLMAAALDEHEAQAGEPELEAGI